MCRLCHRTIARGLRSRRQQDLLSFQKDPLQHALLRRNAGSDEMAQSVFRRRPLRCSAPRGPPHVRSAPVITGYMRDRQTRKTPSELVGRLLELALGGGPSVRDEVILQLCKQVNRHPVR